MATQLRFTFRNTATGEPVTLTTGVQLYDLDQVGDSESYQCKLGVNGREQVRVHACM